MASKKQAQDKADKSANKATEKSHGTPVRKITVKQVWGSTIDFEEIQKSPDGLLPIMDMFGIAARYKPGESDYGPFTRFIGQFRAINLKTGEMFRAPVCLLPKFLEEDLVAAMTQKDGELNNAEFGVRLSAKYDKTAATKYVYIADSLIESGQSDAMTALENRIRDSAQRLLEAPKS